MYLYIYFYILGTNNRFIQWSIGYSLTNSGANSKLGGTLVDYFSNIGLNCCKVFWSTDIITLYVTFQCMSNVPKLTNYLLGDRWKEEINEDNPLGMGGEIARSYTELIKTMWSGKYSYTVPRYFKVSPKEMVTFILKFESTFTMTLHIR